jgi:phage protein U
MDGLILGSPVMLSLGGFQFGISTAAYQDLSRGSEYKWAGQDRFGQTPALQYTGQGADTMSLQGVIYPEWNGGAAQVDNMRAIAGRGEPLLMTSGGGDVLGMWVIEKINEQQGTFAAYGVARKIEFTLELKRYGDAASIMQPMIGLSSGDSILPESVSGVIAQVSSIASQAAEKARELTGTITVAVAEVNAVAGQIGNQINTVRTAVNRSVTAVTGIKNAADDAMNLLSKVSSIDSAMSAANGIFSATTRMSRIATGASSSLKAASELVSSDAAKSAVTSATVAANKITTMIASLRDSVKNTIDGA